MRAGGSKAKGSSFERQVCEKLSLWVSGGKDRDLFWRSAMSGGRSTFAAKKGVKLSRQAGDICGVAPEGHSLTNYFYIECKHLRTLRLELFILEDKGPLARFWKTAWKQAKQYGREPMMIVKGNHCPILVITRVNVMSGQCVCMDREFGCEIRLFQQVLNNTYEPYDDHARNR